MSSHKSKIIDAIKNIEEKQNDLCCAEQKLWNVLVFSNFGEDKPSVTISNDGEVFLEYKGLELDKDGIIECMNVVGYITPNNFH